MAKSRNRRFNDSKIPTERTIKTKAWRKYTDSLRLLSDKASGDLEKYIRAWHTEEETLEVAHALVTKYGEASSELACQMYEALAEYSGAAVSAAEAAATATYGETARAIRGEMLRTRDAKTISSAAGRLVKLASVDTMTKNALRDGAEWAWIPSGDTCPYCLMLASKGWQRASDKIIKNGHATHIHNNCDCTFAVRLSDDVDVEGYDPDALYDEYINAGDTQWERINTLRRRKYAENRDFINAQKRAAYARRREVDAISNDSYTTITVNPKGTKDKDPHKRFDNLSDDPYEKMKSIDNILNDYCKRGSKWKKILEIVDGEKLEDAWGKKNRSCSITVRKDAKTKTYIHELLHARSSSHYEKSVFVAHRFLEEGPVELYAEEICRANGIEFNMSYKDQTRHLRIINSIINPKGKEGIYDFAKELFDIELPDRYNWIKKKISEAYRNGEISKESFRIANRHLVDLSKGK